jgi:tetratricopeptide (TPR) repeat protein
LVWALLIAAAVASSTPQATATLEKEAGDRAAAEGKFDEAGRHYEAAARQDPSEENLFFLGSFLLNHNGFEPASKAIYPNNAYANYYYALCLINPTYGAGSVQGDREGKHYLQRAIELDPSLTDAHYQLGVLLGKANKYADAITELKLATSQEPSMIKAHYRLIQLYRKIGETALAQSETVLVQQLKEQQSR